MCLPDVAAVMALLYAILNSAMTFYAKQNGAPVVLSEISQIQLKYSDLASTAGYLSMMIPPLSWMMVRGLGAGFSSVYSHFASSAISRPPVRQAVWLTVITPTATCRRKT